MAFLPLLLEGVRPNMDPDSDDSWSDTSSEDEDHYNDNLPLHSRAYQVEMFEHSMQGNIIAVVRVAAV